MATLLNTFQLILKLFTSSTAISLSSKEIRVHFKKAAALILAFETDFPLKHSTELPVHWVQVSFLCCARLNAKLLSPELGYQSIGELYCRAINSLSSRRFRCFDFHWRQLLRCLVLLSISQLYLLKYCTHFTKPPLNLISSTILHYNSFHRRQSNIKQPKRYKSSRHLLITQEVSCMVCDVGIKWVNGLLQVSGSLVAWELYGEHPWRLPRRTQTSPTSSLSKPSCE